MHRTRGILATVATILILNSLPLIAAQAQYAPIMPLAAQSLLLDIATAGQRLVVVGERGHILYSDDHGNSWQQSRVPTTQLLTAVFFVDSQHGWAVGHDGLILASDDAGLNWRIQRDGIAAQQQENIEARERSYQQVEQLREQLPGAAANDAQRLEIELEDAALDLEDADLALIETVHTPPLMDIWFQDRQTGWAVGAFGVLLATVNGGRNWTQRGDQLDNPEEAHLNAITGDGEGRLLVAGESGAMFRSVDGGSSWDTLPALYDGSWFGLVYNARPSALLVFGLRGHLFRSTDFGDTWQAVDSGNQMTLAGGSGHEGKIVLAGAVGTVLRSDDGGEHFRTITLPQRLSLSSALVQDDNLVLVGQGGARVVSGGVGHE